MKKKICVFTQTYSDFREELFLYHDLDDLDIYFRNHFDLNLYSFHDVSEDMKNKLLKKSYFLNLNNLEIITYNNISYNQSWKETLMKLKSYGVEKIIFLQDDCFSISSKEKIDALIEYIKNGNFKLLSIERNIDEFKVSNKNIIYDKLIKVYDTYTNDYEGVSYSFDDGPYVGDLDFLIEKVYDDNYYSFGSIWSGELYLKKKMESNIIERYVTSCPSHFRFNIVGANVTFRDENLTKLNKLFLKR
jgi:hypothetical protein